MREWHQPPEFFLEHWTDEEFEMFWNKRNQSMLAEKRAVESLSTSDRPQTPPAPSGRIGDLELFKRMGIGRA